MHCLPNRRTQKVALLQQPSNSKNQSQVSSPTTMPADNICLFYSSNKKRTVIYKTYYGDDVVFVIQQKQGTEWENKRHLMLPRNVLQIAFEFAGDELESPLSDSDSNPAQFSCDAPDSPLVDLDSEPAFHVYVPHSTLPDDLRVLLYNYDIKLAPFCDSHFKLVDQIDLLLQFWELETTYKESASPLHFREDPEESDTLKEQTAKTLASTGPTVVENPANIASEKCDPKGNPTPIKLSATQKRRLTQQMSEDSKIKQCKNESNVHIENCTSFCFN